MAHNQTPAEINSFISGFFSDTSLLSAPPTASREEVNFEMDRKGRRSRRLGMDEETGATFVDTGLTSSDLTYNTFVWRNAGGDPNSKFVVVQMGTDIRIHSLSAAPYSTKVVQTYSSFGPEDTRYSFTAVDGLLICVTSEKEYQVIEYNATTETFTLSADILYIRDLFGVEDIIDGDNLLEANNVTIRPSTTTDEHTYNLRNQSWAPKRRNGNTETDQDPLISFYAEDSTFPSNSDYVTYSLWADSGDSDNRVIERFFADDLIANAPASERSASGYYIIDALERGASRLSAVQATESDLSYSTHLVADLPTDTTPNGPAVVASYSGRVFFGGFSGEITDGDSKSPRMSSYVLFSKLIESAADVGLCYQSGDPTSKESPDLVDTDGGFIRLDEAYGILGMVNISKALIVICENGVWAISGGTDYGFKATDYQVQRLTDRGCISSTSIVVLENSVVFWGDDGIYQVNTSQLGDLQAVNICLGKISSYYDELDTTSKMASYGVYDSLSKKVKWVFNSYLNRSTEVQELVFNTTYSAWTLNTIQDSSVKKLTVGPIVKAGNIVISSDRNYVVVGGVQVQADGEDVVILEPSLREGARETVYLIIDHTPGGNITYSFGEYNNKDFLDWEAVDGVGTDAAAYIVTYPVTGGDSQRKKQIKSLTTHLQRTENGVVLNDDGDYELTNPSSCYLQTRWDFTSTDSTGKWSREFQVYRIKRAYMTDGEQTTFDSGEEILSNRHKIRGRGRAFSFQIRTEAGKDCVILGWSLIVGANTDI